MTDQAPDTGELTYTRVFDAPRELVFRCMLEPEHLTHFWGPAGVSTPLETIKVDARPGGVFETVMVNDSDGGRYPRAPCMSRSWNRSGSCGPNPTPA